MGEKKYAIWLEPENLLKLGAWARDGLTDDEIAAKMQIARSTLSAWKIKYKELADALKNGKEIADIRVENALYKRAIGYEYEETTYENGIETKRVRKHMPPDTTAQIYWLKNRKPNSWRNKPEESVESEGVTIVDNL